MRPQDALRACFGYLVETARRDPSCSRCGWCHRLFHFLVILQPKNTPPCACLPFYRQYSRAGSPRPIAGTRDYKFGPIECVRPLDADVLDHPLHVDTKAFSARSTHLMPKQVFLSDSARDGEFVNQPADDLRESGLDAGFDKRKKKHGVPRAKCPHSSGDDVFAETSFQR